VDEAQAQQSIADLRSNETSTNWILFKYSDSTKNGIELVGSGANGVEELKQHLSDNKVFYGLVRVTDKIDQSVTVKFVFIVWVGEKVSFVQKGKITTHKGSITSLIGQYHNDVHASNLSELSEDIVLGKVRDASGTSSRVKESSHQTPAPASASAASPTHSTRPSSSHSLPTKAPGVPQANSVVVFLDEDNIRAAIKALRSDADDTDWVLLTYEGQTNKIYLFGKGNGGIDELLPHLKENEIFYGLYRTTDTVDNTVAVKFVLILWVGEKVPIIRKARITTHKGEVTSFIGQYHVDIQCSNLNEVNEDIIQEAVQKASGTANYVK
jgi:hypothetical protein